jgi:hypothetical protein
MLEQTSSAKEGIQIKCPQENVAVCTKYKVRQTASNSMQPTSTAFNECVGPRYHHSKWHHPAMKRLLASYQESETCSQPTMTKEVTARLPQLWQEG